MSQDTVDLFWHIGDINYGDVSGIPYFYESTTETWMDGMTGIWTVKPYMVLPGNHDSACSFLSTLTCTDGEKNFSSFRQRFRMPAVESGALNNMYYSFDYGLVHFVSIDTESTFPGAPEGPGTWLSSGPFGDQLGWLESDLDKAVQNRDVVPWIVVGGHRPYYTEANPYLSDRAVREAIRAAFEPILIKYSVDVVFMGHVHWYERLWPVFNNTVQQRNYTDATAPIYIVSGAAGNGEGTRYPQSRERLHRLS